MVQSLIRLCCGASEVILEDPQIDEDDEAALQGDVQRTERHMQS